MAGNLTSLSLRGASVLLAAELTLPCKNWEVGEKNKKQNRTKNGV